MPPLLEEPPRREEPAPDAWPDRPGEEGGPTELSKDAIFEILRSSRRREVLYYLNERADEASIGTLAEHVAGVENDVDPDDLTSTQRKRLYISLYQSHLPKMADYGIIEFDGRDTVRLREPARVLFPYLYAVPGRGVPLHRESAGPLARLRAWVRRRLPR